MTALKAKPSCFLMSAPAEVQRLVENFDAHIDSYKAGSYNETQLRVDFVDPLFSCMGWDINNQAGFAESYRDVLHEYTLKTKDGTKAPDYCFCIGGARKFFLETKKPAVHIKDDAAPAFQLRRYGWSASLPLSILTDFEEFAVYDCRIKPQQKDRASVARLMYFTYKDYLDEWEELAGLFSKRAIQQGAFDTFVSSDKKKKGASEIDKSFLADMERWRELLAKNIALRNAKLSQKEMNHYVQATMDRIIFLRICEDRNIEEYGRLQELLKKERVYKGLCRLFRQADAKYNSGLFCFEDERGRGAPDRVSLRLAVDDKPLQEIIRHLYYPQSPYVFSQIPAEILGQVYEKFLGKVIRLTPAHQAKVEEKPEVRKAGGVYYTPKYVVDYIVKNTVGALLKNKTPAQAKKLRVLDPACGSGSFLLGAYQFLLRWYLQSYSKEPAKNTKRIYQDDKGRWSLATREKKEILLSNIYGVDIDRQAVEVTKLSLLLQVLEGENSDTLDAERRLFAERALPDLRHNIKCGNSLIGTDFFYGKNLDIFEQNEMEKINAFDWDDEARGFGEIMREGGFDAVIGNPPYGAEITAVQRKYIDNRLDYSSGTKNSAIYFISLAKQLLSPNGILSFIIPKSVCYSNGWKECALMLIKRLVKLIDVEKAFQGVKLEQIIFLCDQNNKKDSYTNGLVINGEIKQQSIVKKSVFSKYNILLAGQVKSEIDIINKITTNFSKMLSDYVFIERGLNWQSQVKEKRGQTPVFRGAQLNRYALDDATDFISLKKFSKGEYEYQLKPKLLNQLVIAHVKNPYPHFYLQGFLDFENRIVFETISCIFPQDKAKVNLYFLLGLNNSKLFAWLLYKFVFSNAIRSIRFDNLYVKKIPVPDLNEINQSGIAKLATQILAAQKKLHTSKSDSDRRHYQQKADILDRQIDALVYELYELRPEEIRIVEGRGCEER